MTVRYSRDHEWVRIEGDLAVVGITDYAQKSLGDIVFVELPAAGKAIEAGTEAAVVESVKAASEVFSPVSGVVVAVNEALAAEPAKINDDPAGAGWILKMKLSDRAQFDALMDEAAYAAFLKTL
ncbi:MAG: glycine cleavage system protein GcvH [Hyphomicrobiales bacterium]|nr:glycine cleavage system protein GcvH [Hyphomicrobiales bacterium]MDE2017429.1 glycine cleavage system protein GcvH [Hyphomicrobiales bacterium]